MQPEKIRAGKNPQIIKDFTLRVLNKFKQDASKLAIVFDVDETLLLNHEDESLNKFAANKPIVDIYNHALKLGYDIFIITARRKSAWAKQYLLKQLKALGMTKFKSIYMLSKEFDQDPSASRFKLEARKRIRAKYEKQILCNIGDSISDLFLLSPYTQKYDRFINTLDSNKFYAILTHDGISMISLKLPNTYVVS